MTHTPFSSPVRNPWALSSPDPRDVHPSSVVYDDGEYYVAELCRDSFLYFKRIGEGFYAFNQLAGYKAEYIDAVKLCLAGEPIEGTDAHVCLAERGAECIRAWEERCGLKR